MGAPFTNFTVGRDNQFVFVFPLVGVLQPKNIVAIDIRPLDKDLVSHGIDGVARFGTVPAGYEGTVTIDRASRDLGDFWAAVEANYYAGNQVLPGYIEQYINEADGSVSQYRYEQCSMRISDFGSVQGDQKQAIKARFNASFRTKVA